jgi:hypothetical protein
MEEEIIDSSQYLTALNKKNASTVETSNLDQGNYDSKMDINPKEYLRGLTSMGENYAHNPTEQFSSSGQRIRFGDSKYDKGLDSILAHNLGKVRAERQGGWAEFGNAIVGGLASGVLTALETIGLIIEAPFNPIEELSKEENLDQWEYNEFSGAMKEAKETLLQEYLPIYKKNPEKMIDFNDSAFYWEAFRGVIDSAVGFGATGMGAGFAVKAAGVALKGARLSRYASMMGKALETGKLGQLSTAYITNYGEGKMMGLELYEQATQKHMQSFLKAYKEKHGAMTEPSPEELKEFQLDAKIAAGKEASKFMLANKTMIFTDYLQLGSMFKSAKRATDNMVTPTTIKSFWMDQLATAPIEAGEEITQNIFQMEGIHQTRMRLKTLGHSMGKDNLDDMNLSERVVQFGTSEQALLEGAMGLFGGPVQYAITTAPFTNNAAIKKQQIVQEATVKESKNFIDTVVYNDVMKSATIEEAKVIGIDLVQNANDLEYDMLLIKTFMNGTTGKFLDSLNSLKEKEGITPEMSQEIDKKIQRVSELEKEFLSYEDYDSKANILDTRIGKRFLEVTKKQIDTQYSNKLRDLQQKINTYSKDKKSAPISTEELLGDLAEKHVIKSLENNKLKDSTFLNGLFSEEIAEIKRLFNEQEAFTQLIAENEDMFVQYKKEDNLIGEATDIANSRKIDTKEKIIKLKNLKNQAVGEHVKNVIDKKIKYKEEELASAQKDDKNVKDDTTIKPITKKKVTKGEPEFTLPEDFDEEGNTLIPIPVEGVSEIEKKAALAEKVLAAQENMPSEILQRYLDSVQDGEDPHEAISDALRQVLESNEDMSPEEMEDMGLLIQDIDDITDTMKRALEQHDKDMLAQGVEEPEFTKYAPDDIGDEPAWSTSDIQDINESAQFGNDVTHVNKTIPDKKQQNNIIAGLQQIPKIEGQEDVKVVFTGGSVAFRQYQASNDNKEGDAVEYVLGDGNVANDEDREAYQDALKQFKEGAEITDELLELMPIKVIFKGDANNYSYLFAPDITDSQDAYEAEMQLRREILHALRNGKKATSKVAYQYSGGITNGKNRKLTTVFTAKNLNLKEGASAREIKDNIISRMMFTDANGNLKNVSTRNLNSMFDTELYWKGALFIAIDGPNGPVPIKLNTAPLNDNEVRLVQAIYLNIIQHENFQNKILSEEKVLYKLLGEADKKFLGKNAKVSDINHNNSHNNSVLEHLMYNNSTNKVTGIRYDKGRLKFGNNEINKENINSPAHILKLNDFIRTFKGRDVNLMKFQKGNAKYNEKYIDFILDNGIVVSDLVSARDGNFFTSKEDVDYTNPANRFLSKAIYVKPYLDSSIKPDTKKQSKEKKGKEAKKEEIKTNRIVSDIQIIQEKVTGKPAVVKITKSNAVNDILSNAKDIKPAKPTDKPECP